MASREPWFESWAGARLRFGLRFIAHPRKTSCVNLIPNQHRGARPKSRISNATVTRHATSHTLRRCACKCKFTRPYPNFLFLGPLGYPQFPPSAFANVPPVPPQPPTLPTHL